MSIVILLATSCNVLKFVPKDKSLVDANFVKVEGDVKIENIKEEILLVPNRKMLGFIKFNLWSYYFGQKVFKRDSVYGRIVDRESGKKVVTHGKKPNKFKRIFTEIIGEKPVYLDTSLVVRSEKNIVIFLINKGYYQARVTSKIRTVLKRSYITYTVFPGSPYVIREVFYNGSDRLLDTKANSFAKQSKLKAGDRVDTEKLSEERDRLTSAFRDSGFYYFNKAFIEIVVDTGGHDRGAHLYYNITNPGAERNARQQSIKKVIVEMNFPQEFGRQDTIGFSGIQYLYNGYNIKPNIINRSIKLRPKDLFSQSQLEATYKKLLGLGLFKSVNITILPYKSDTTNMLLVYINLTPSAKHDFIWEPQAITSDKQVDLSSQDNNPRNYGIANSMMLNNKNFIRSAADVNLKWRFAAEKQFGKASSGVPLEILGTTFNVGNYETNLTLELLFPKLLGLRKLDLKPFLQQNRTSLNLSFVFEKNTNYQRRSIPINFTWQTGYETKDKQMFYFYYSPLQLSFNNSVINPEFLQRLDNPIDSLRLVRTFRSYIIPSQKFSIVYNNAKKSPTRFWSIRSNVFELSGNLIELGYRKVRNDYRKDKNLFGIPYFQYFRTDVDVVRHRLFANNRKFIWRCNVGLGLPYGNSVIMPFERQFFVGGSNSLRGWRPRVLGPGTFNNENAIQIDKTGDMMIVANAEFRFAIAPGKLEGALFLDAGNIWEVTRTAHPDAKFEFGTFYTQAALNTGIGLRFDLSFFVLRLDFGIPIHDPSYPDGERMVIVRHDSFKDFILNINPSLAVGYPF